MHTCTYINIICSVCIRLLDVCFQDWTVTCCALPWGSPRLPFPAVCSSLCYSLCLLSVPRLCQYQFPRTFAFSILSARTVHLISKPSSFSLFRTSLFAVTAPKWSFLIPHCVLLSPHCLIIPLFHFFFQVTSVSFHSPANRLSLPAATRKPQGYRDTAGITQDPIPARSIFVDPGATKVPTASPGVCLESQIDKKHSATKVFCQTSVSHQVMNLPPLGSLAFWEDEKAK